MRELTGKELAVMDILSGEMRNPVAADLFNYNILSYQSSLDWLDNNGYFYVKCAEKFYVFKEETTSIEQTKI